MVLELANGPCIAMEIVSSQPDSNVYLDFRNLCGPTDPVSFNFVLIAHFFLALTYKQELAKQLRPNTIRARYGNTKVMNAIHCTDLEEDTQIEVEYFFKILN